MLTKLPISYSIKQTYLLDTWPNKIATPGTKREPCARLQQGLP